MKGFYMGFFSDLFQVWEKSMYRANILKILDNEYSAKLSYGIKKIPNKRLNYFYEYGLERLENSDFNFRPIPNPYLFSMYITAVIIDDMLIQYSKEELKDPSNFVFSILSGALLDMDMKKYEHTLKYIDEKNLNDDYTETELYIMDFSDSILKKIYTEHL